LVEREVFLPSMLGEATRKHEIKERDIIRVKVDLFEGIP
jgi:hypothetical protein